MPTSIKTPTSSKNKNLLFTDKKIHFLTFDQIIKINVSPFLSSNDLWLNFHLFVNDNKSIVYFFNHTVFGFTIPWYLNLVKEFTTPFDAKKGESFYHTSKNRRTTKIEK